MAQIKPAAYPLSLRGELDPQLSRWLWLVKWLLLIPHLIVLIGLWVAFAVLTVVAGVAILINGRYPRRLFDFNVGVLRWTWRVSFYSYLALATDRYPPFSLSSTDYPADLSVEYPERLSRGLVLVKWWLLAIPHYLVVGILNGGSSYRAGNLVMLLALFGAIAVLFTRRYPGGIFELIMGLNRWTQRVTVYAALMTDVYPPFRLDMTEPDTSGPGASST